MPNPPLRLLGIPGSLRRASFNRGLLTAAQRVCPDGVTLEIHDLIDVPLYNGDVEAEGTPEAVVALKNAIADADGLLIASPEYNGSMSGVIKNAFDWVSRKPSPLGGKPCAVISASPGGAGGTRAQPPLKMMLHVLGAELPPLRQVAVSGASGKFTDGALTDDTTRDRLGTFMSGYAAWLMRHEPA